MILAMEPATKKALFEYLQRLGDDLLILGHRLSEWCGHGPVLEEDVAMANMALDCIGQAEALLQLAGEVEGLGRDEDQLAYFRDEYEFRNLQMVEQPKGDFAFTMARQFLFDSHAWHLYSALKTSSFQPLADIAAKVHKEITYHLRHSRTWLHRLGNGTAESHQRMQAALDSLWRYTPELFYMNEVDQQLIAKGIVPDLESLRTPWLEMVAHEIRSASLTLPPDSIYMPRSRQGMHSEHLGFLLSQMQILARSHPGATW